MDSPTPEPRHEIVRAGSEGPAPADLDRVVDALRSGAPIVFPTETFYGLGARALDPAAVDRVHRIKGRPAGKPFPVIVSSLEMLEELVTRVPGVARTLIERYWPGALTIVLPARDGLPSGIVAGNGTIACRISSSGAATAIVRALGEPLVATSANRSGDPSPRTAGDAAKSLGETVSLIVDGGTLAGVLGSTIVDGTQDPPSILRHGDLEVDL